MSISPQQLIADQQAKVAELRRALAEAEATLKGMEAIFSVTAVTRRRNNATGGDDRSIEPSAGGRQPGAISQRWRVILNQFYNREEGFTPQDTVELVLKLESRAMKPSEARRLLEGYEEHGYIARNAAGRLFVTQDAARRFGFVKIPKVSEFPPPPAPHTTTPALVIPPPPPPPPPPPSGQVPPPPSNWVPPNSHSLTDVLGTRGPALDQQNPFSLPPPPPTTIPASQWAGVGRTPPIHLGGGKNEGDK